jgi:hypothetical protein
VDFGAAASQANSKQVMLAACDGSAGQQFVVESSGNLHGATGGKKLCVALENFEGPGVVMWSCNTGENEEFAFDATDGSLCSKGDSAHAARCLVPRTTNPRPPSPPSASPTMQIWAKPQPDGAVAVLVINNYEVGAAGNNQTVTIDFADVRFKSAGASTVFDIWAEKTIAPVAAGATSFTTDSFGAHDSRFYLISPA